MAVVNRDSTAIADMVSVPVVFVSPSKGAAGQMFESGGYLAQGTDDSATSIHRFCRVPSNARVSSVLWCCADATTAGAVDIGVYQTPSNGGAVVDADFFASALDLTGGPFNNSEQAFESGVYTYAKSFQPLWQALGLSADSNRDYDIAVTITTTYNGVASGQALKVRYVI